jgi:chloramphenicol 3-O-phosphotransferase
MDGVVMTRSEPADCNQPAACPVHMNGRRVMRASRAARKLMRSSMKPSYDEKKRKKSRVTFRNFFRR